MGKAAETEQSIVLGDGRRLGYAEYGDPNGAPVFYFHGSPGSRLEALVYDAAAKEAGVRLIAPDRPGYGASDFLPHRQFDHWPLDVAALADALAFGRFGVVGLSGGGPHVVACAVALRDRLTSATIASGAGPIDAYLARSRSRFGRMLRRAGLPGTRLFLNLGLRLLPFMLRRSSAERMSTWVDRQVLARLDMRVAFRADFIEAFRHGSRGARHEFGMHTRGWPFALKDASMTVHLWHGGVDVVVPDDIGRYVAAGLPDCRARFLAGEGHLLIVDHIAEMLRVAKSADDVARALAPR